MPMQRHLYPREWPAISLRIRERDGNCCQFCGVANTSPAISKRTGKTYRIVLTVAHLDHNPGNNDDSNLASLCQSCHLRLDAKQHAENACKTREAKRKAAMKLPTLAMIAVELNRAHLHALARIQVTDSEGVRYAKLVFLFPMEAQEYEIDSVTDLTEQIRQLHGFNCFGVLRVRQQTRREKRNGWNILTHCGTLQERQEWRRGIDNDLNTVFTAGEKKHA